MKIKISELEGAALTDAAVRTGRISADEASNLYAAVDEHLRLIVAAHTDGDTVEVPDELVEVRA